MCAFTLFALVIYPSREAVKTKIHTTHSVLLLCLRCGMRSCWCVIGITEGTMFGPQFPLNEWEGEKVNFDDISRFDTRRKMWSHFGLVGGGWR
jgi:hypothetical protein